jgi:hypothetical protein
VAPQSDPRPRRCSYSAQSPASPLKVFSTRAGIASTRQQPGIDFDQLIDSDDTLYIVGTEDVQSELRPIFVGLIDALIVRVGERVQKGQRAPEPLLPARQGRQLSPTYRLTQIRGHLEIEGCSACHDLSGLWPGCEQVGEGTTLAASSPTT